MSSYIITKAHLELQRRDTLRFSAALNESRITDSTSSSSVTVFLSHKHDEVAVLHDVISLLRRCGVDVYVDWMDEGMPKTTSGQTAVKLKDKINSCKKFIFLGTEGAIASKWCNWELGLGDAKKYPANIAVMPIADKDGIYTGSEYLQIYPVIKTEYWSIPDNYFVEWENTKISLKDWLRK